MADTFARKTKGALARKFYSLAPGHLQYVLHKRRFQPNLQAWIDAPCFMLHVPKCGGKSIAAALNLPDPGHTLLSDMPKDLQRKLAKKPVLVVVRDPIDRIVSTFKFAHRHIAEGRNRTFAGLVKSKDINQFVQQTLSTQLRDTRHFFRAASVFVDAAEAVGMRPELIDFANLDVGSSRFFLNHDVSVGDIPRINASDARSDLELRLTETSKEKIIRLYSRDVDLYARAVSNT